MDSEFQKIVRDRTEISVRYDPHTEALWVYSNPKSRPCYSLRLLEEVHELQLSIIEYFKRSGMKPKTPVKYFVIASQTVDVFNYGGDLNLFSALIMRNERELLYNYAKLCIDIVYLNAVNLNLPLTTVALIEGTALGGGFECAVSCNVCIAEEGSQIGLPEIRFNLIPGMGAYSFLARIAGVKIAEEIIGSGKVYDAQELYAMGVITMLAEKGEGVECVNEYIRKNSRLFNGMLAIQKARHRYTQIAYEELMDITQIWVDSAFNIRKKDLKMMQKLVDAQDQKEIDTQYKRRTPQDRRFAQEKSSFPFADSHGELVRYERRSSPDRRAKSEGINKP